MRGIAPPGCANVIVMASLSESGSSGLRALYESELEPYLAAQDHRVQAARRNRWLVLILGLGIAAAILVWAWESGTDIDLFPMAGFGLAVLSIGYFWFATASVADDLRHELMGRLAKWLGLAYEADAAGFDLERFAVLGLAGCSKVKRADRLSGTVSGLAAEMMAARLADETTTGAGKDRHTQTTERFSGLLMRIADPAPVGARFRLVPPAGAATGGMLRGVSVMTNDPSADMEAMLAAEPGRAAAAPIGDAVFDARFELQAPESGAAAALRRLDAGTRAALLDIASSFGGGPVSVGFDGGEILLAFVTKQRFEIGLLRPPMAQFERVQHLADQMGIMGVVAGRLRGEGERGSTGQ